MNGRQAKKLRRLVWFHPADARLYKRARVSENPSLLGSLMSKAAGLFSFHPGTVVSQGPRGQYRALKRHLRQFTPILKDSIHG